MQIKIHEAYRTIVAVADTELIGKRFSEDIREIFVRPNFFQGEEKTKEEIIEILKDMEKEDATFNIVLMWDEKLVVRENHISNSHFRVEKAVESVC